MAKIFITYSSENKEFAIKLSTDLEILGHEPWLDEWEIRVGDCIPSKIGIGLADADYCAVILSNASAKSKWVDREWNTKYGEEIQKGRTIILPVLLEECEMPTLLKSKKYADFRKGYSVGLVNLMGGISPLITRDQKTEKAIILDDRHDVTTMIAKVQSRSAPLAQCITESLSIAKKYGDTPFEIFCRNELAGWNQKSLDAVLGDKPTYRFAEVFVSPSARINMQFWGWGTNVQNIFEHMKTDRKNFFHSKKFFSEAVSEMETKRNIDPNKEVLTMEMQHKDIMPGSKTPDATVLIYARADTFEIILESIRVELTKRLLDLLPKIEVDRQ